MTALASLSLPLVTLLAASPAISECDVRPATLTCEYLTDPLGIDVAAPRLSWILNATSEGRRDLGQRAYQVQVATSMERLQTDVPDLWDSGRVTSDQSLHVTYGGVPLESQQWCFWRVRVWDQAGRASEWSETAHWSMGILSPEEWGGQWIGYTRPEGRGRQPSVTLGDAHWIWHLDPGELDDTPAGVRYLRRAFELGGGAAIESAACRLTADDRFTLWVNGQEVSRSADTGMAWRSPVDLDLTASLRAGTNVIALRVSNDVLGPAGVALALRVGFADGSTFELTSDGQWVSTVEAPGGWSSPDFDDSGWTSVRDLGPMGSGPWGQVGLRDDLGSAQTAPSPLLRREFTVDQPIVRATGYVSGLGYYELRANGVKVGDSVLDPAFTRYDRRVLYATYDLTPYLHEGVNALGIMLGNGWYNMHARAEWNFDTAPWRDEPKARMHVRLELADGSVQTIVTDGAWEGSTGPVRHDCIRNGEIYDARRERDGWDRAGYRGVGWGAADVRAAPAGELRAQMAPPIRVVGSIRPVALWESSPGVWVYDLGQNIAGWAQITVLGEAGTEVTLRYGERLNDDRSLRQDEIAVFVYQGLFQTDRYILRGGGTERWEPRFSYHGFQYVEVSGFPGTPTLDSLRGRVVQTDFPSAGSFSCSSDLLNWIQEAARWAYRGNFVGYPTDCPHREKNGWTGDGHLACETGLLNFDNAAAYARWMNDFKDEQRPNGEIPGIVPTSGWGYGIGPAWDSAYILIPWYLYRYRGDLEVLADHYEGMQRYVDHLDGRFPTRIVDWGLGDWAPARTEAPRDLTSTACFYVDALVVADVAELLGHAEDAAHYRALAVEVREALDATFRTAPGLYGDGSQTAQSCALYQGFVDPDERDPAIGHLLDAVDAAEGHLDVGILGAKYILPALSEAGHADVAYRLVTAEGFPGYAHWRDLGATTLWENWDGGASRNHIMFGDVSAWFYRTLAGIQLAPDAVAYKRFVLRPRPVTGLEWVAAEHQSPYGPIRSAWRRMGDQLHLEFAVPPNTRARIVLPTTSVADVTAEGRPLSDMEGLWRVSSTPDGVTLEVGSGEYTFQIAD